MKDYGLFKQLEVFWSMTVEEMFCYLTLKGIIIDVSFPETTKTT